MNHKKLPLIGFCLTILIAASSIAALLTPPNAVVAALAVPQPNLTATTTPASTSSVDVLGPELEQFPAGVSPLTGLPVSDPEMLDLPAVIVSLSNFPASARPQTGLSFAPQVYEIYISEGMTRFLTVFYGEMPTSNAAPSGEPTVGTPGQAVTSTPAALGLAEQPGDNPSIEGIRSGREAYVPIINAFPNGCLVAASKAATVNVKICKNVYGKDPNNINSAGLTVNQLVDIARANQNPNRLLNYSGNVFASQIPAGGQPASKMEVFYAYLNQSYWQYDPAAGAYLRYEDFADPERVGEFQVSTDRLTGLPLTFENVVILYVEHFARTSTIIDLKMDPGMTGRAVVLRNGNIYQNVMWSTVNEAYERSSGLVRPIRLRYADGTPFPLSPGNTWFHVATTNSAVWNLDSAGTWRYRYYPPQGAK